MTITALPTAPQATDTQAVFNTRAFAWVAALNTFVTEANALAAAADADASAALSYKTIAASWASKTDGQVDATDYSAKAWAIGGTGVTGGAGSAKEWASKMDGVVAGSDYSAKYYSTQAASSAAAAAAAAAASMWVSGTTYAAGSVVYSPIDFQSYRRIVSGAGTTDPSLDPTKWTQISGGGDVDGPAGATDNAIPRFDGTTGKLLQGSGVKISDGNDLELPASIKETVFTTTDGAAFEINPSNGTVQVIVLGASRTPKGTSFQNGQSVTLMVDDGSAFTLTWTDATWGGSGVIWKTDNGVAPRLNTTGYTAIVLWKLAGQVYGARVGDA